MNASDRFYFDNFKSTAALCRRAAEYLCEVLCSYDPDHIGETLGKMHALEHEADKNKHALSAALAGAFVTPLDREDLALVGQQMDDVCDRIEEVLQSFYVHGVQTVLADAPIFAEKLTACCGLLSEIMDEFPHFKKSARLHGLVVALGEAEENCDRFYLEAAASLRGSGMELWKVIAWREIFTTMEMCADACERVGDTVDIVVMKNT